MAHDEEPSDWTSGLWPFRNEAEANEPTPLIELRGTRTGDGFTLTSVHRMTGAAWWAHPVGWGLKAVLRDAEGRELARCEMRMGMMHVMGPPGPLAGIEPAGCTTIPTREYFGSLRDVPGAVELLVLDEEDRTLLQLRAPDRQPEVRDLRVSIEDETVRIEWRDDVQLDSCWREIAWSSTMYLRPRAIAPRFDLEEMQRGEATLPLWRLPPGLVFIRVLVHDVFGLLMSEPVTVLVPERRPYVEIAHDFAEHHRHRPTEPVDVATLLARPRIMYFVAKQEPYDDPLPHSAFRWMLNGVEIARGPKVSLEWKRKRFRLLTLAVTWPGGVFATNLQLGHEPPKRQMRWVWPEKPDRPAEDLPEAGP